MSRSTPFAAGLGLALLCGSASAEWTSTGSPSSGLDDKAGFSNGFTFEAMWFTCESLAPGMLKLIFTGFDPSLPTGVEHTVVVTVDGTAYLQGTRSERNDMEGDVDLVRSASMAEFTPLIEALKAGKGAEISSPTGRTDVPLTGSGKALAALQAGCGE